MMRAIFLDRDGVINDNTKHVNKPEDLIIYEEAKKGMKKLYEKGYDLFIVTNQGGIERGHLIESDLDKIHAKLEKELEDYCKIREIKYCPDFNKKSYCRKPNPGMLLELKDKYNIDMKNSWMVGDLQTDIDAGINAGCNTAKIGKKSPNADIVGQNLDEVAEKIINLT